MNGSPALFFLIVTQIQREAFLKVAFVQTEPVFGDVEGNVSRAISMLKELGAELVVLPELFSTGYRFTSKEELLSLAEMVEDGLAVARLKEAASALKMHIVAGFAERQGDRAFNSAVLIGPAGVIGVYRKAHLFANEKEVFTPGDTPFEVYDIGLARIGMMICFDWVFPEVARTLALKGADIICQPANLVLPFCPQAMITRSLENRVFSITANRVGVEERVAGERLGFIGQSQIVGPNGRLYYRGSEGSTEARVIEIDPKEARDKAITPQNDLFRDRRTDLFGL